MTWPNYNITSEHLDQGTDTPTLARAELKTAADAMNSMMPEINTDSATSNQVLAHNGTKFVPTTLSSLTGDVARIAVVGLGGTGATNGDDVLVPVGETADPNNIVSVSNDRLVLGAGTYYIFNAEKFIMEQSGGNNPNYEIRVYNVVTPTGESPIYTAVTQFTGDLGGARYYATHDIGIYRTVNTSETLSFWRPSSGTSYSTNLVIYKVS
jgi:hypothetical protein